MRRVRLLLILAALIVLAVAGIHGLRRVPVDPPPPPDYAQPSAWLCRSGRGAACSATTATVFAAGQPPARVVYTPDPAAPIDCFYLYPTVSQVRAAYAPIGATSAEIDVVRHQLARFSTVCRLFAPLYRQVTSAGLPLLFGAERGVTIDVPYADVVAAWRTYIARDNAGRGVVLIGHSQGARLLARLLREEIDGKPDQARLVSAILPGTRIDVPKDQRVGGTLKHVPLCASATEVGCVIAYSSYPVDRAMPAQARFGVTSTPGQRFACVDPAALDGSASLEADLPMRGEVEATYGTTFAEVPGLLTSACRDDGRFSVLAVAAAPKDPVGERVKARLDRMAEENPAFGLHPLDINLALGTLVDIVRKQAAAYLQR